MKILSECNEKYKEDKNYNNEDYKKNIIITQMFLIKRQNMCTIREII